MRISNTHCNMPLVDLRLKKAIEQQRTQLVRWVDLLVADNRVKPTGALPTDEEKAKLFGTMIAYAGTYRIDGEKVIHDVQVSWNQLWTGSQQVRFFKAESDTLTNTTAVAKSPRDGLEGRTIVVFKKVH